MSFFPNLFHFSFTMQGIEDQTTFSFRQKESKGRKDSMDGEASNYFTEKGKRGRGLEEDSKKTQRRLKESRANAFPKKRRHLSGSDKSYLL